MASPKIAPELTVEQIRELLHVWSQADTQCLVCQRITGQGGQWCPYCGGEVKKLGEVR